MTKDTIFISEIYLCFQGEGRFCGQRIALVRTSGCNLRCKWGENYCDTPFTSWNREGVDKTINEVVEKVKLLGVNAVVISGGEPYLQPKLPELVRAFADKRYHITIETNGTIYKPTQANFLSISPKLKSSTPTGTVFETMHEEKRQTYENTAKLIEKQDYQLKFVITSQNDLNEVLAFQQKLNVPNDKIWLMPEGICKSDLERTAIPTAELALQHGFNYSDRVHIRMYGNQRGV